MDQIKQKLTLNQSSKEETKKLRNDFDQSSIISIENLSNELFCEIFDYLDGYQVYNGFSNLNHRFQQLLNALSYLFKLNFYYSTSKEPYLNNYKQFFLLYKHKIFSIEYNYSFKFEDKNLFALFTINSSLNRLESLNIHLSKTDELISILIQLACLPRLFSLTIHPREILENLNEIYRLVFALPALKSFRFFGNMTCEPISLPMATNEQLSPIEYLSIYHSCTFNEIFTLLSYTPQVRRLYLFSSINIDTSIQTLLPITLSNLTDISLPMRYIKFDVFEIMIRKINAKLKVLRVCIQSEDIAFLDAHRWERFILQSLPRLEEFYFRYCETFDGEYGYPTYPGGANQFTSLFWIQRQWIFGAEILGETIEYSIRPYRKRWYEYTQDTISRSSIDYSKSTRLTIRYVELDNHDLLLTADPQRILTIAQMYHLEIEKKVYIGGLIEAVNFFPEVNTLKIRTLSLLHKPRSFNSEGLTLSSTKDRNRITKVYLEKMNDLEEFSFLLELCPYMAYFKVDYIKYIKFKFVLRYIFDIMAHPHNTRLRLFCFRTPTADEELIQKLKNMIHFRKLLCNYAIKRVADNIYIEWK